MAKKFFICFLIMLLTIYPASAAEVTLNRWVLNVTINDNGTVEEAIQAEIENGGSLPVEGISFVIPASGVTVIYGFFNTYHIKGLVAEPQAVPGGTKIVVNFNESVKPGEKWSGRISFSAEKWAVKEGSNYSINIPIEKPQAVVSGKNIDISVSSEPDVRSQVFLPRSVEVISVKPQPFRILFQYDRMVPTWSPDKLHIGDTIILKGSFSGTLNKIVETDEKWRELKTRINATKAQGVDVSEAERHLALAEDYNTNQALQGFYKQNNSMVLEYVGYANNELKLAEDSLSVKENTKETTRPTEGKNTPEFAAPVLISILLVTFLIRRRK